ncbi:MAG: hypothetical protein ACD_49C00070G0015 [uncultured bacterium (gcode 4)]|uniref:Uncharacterized protein n=1 Tax=uncultured bacterium (gcode 4) TaxID=1234023 RepID=K2AWA9_9BACT|nr:MAG: hypothetical protein ACD_49C00070G0015 [uncultured bacterium (gcode 4)]
MTASILVRTDTDLKKRFEEQAKRQGLSMTFLLTSFMKTYSDAPDIIKVGLDEEIIDNSWKSAKTSKSMKSLSKTLQSKWL